MLKGILTDHLWQNPNEAIKYLEDLLYHFNFVNERNIGKGYRNKFWDPELYFGKSDSRFNASKKENLVGVSCVDFPNSVQDFSKFDPMLFDPVVIALHQSPVSKSELEAKDNFILVKSKKEIIEIENWIDS